MPVLKEFVHLLTNDLPVIGFVVAAHDLQVLHSHNNVLLFRRSFDELLHCEKVPHGVVIYLFWLADLLSLVLHSHKHEVEELLHAGCIQLHDGAVSELLKDLPRAHQRVHLLGPE